jgi:3'-phosphoadenosine 5'-phosphosulfate (PAPS) 3'-phosphatase
MSPSLLCITHHSRLTLASSLTRPTSRIAFVLNNVITAAGFVSAFRPAPSTFTYRTKSPRLLASQSADMSISTVSLLSSLVDAARHGSETIYRLSDEARSGDVHFKEEGEARSAMTIADTAAQKVIVSSLLSKYPQLNIVGEEDEPIEIDAASKKELNDTMLDHVEFYLPSFVKESDDFEDAPAELKLDEIVCYVDPLDGTREFVEGRLSNVQCLIGLCWRGRPLLGAIGLPFGMSEEQESTEVVFGLVGKGTGKVRCKKGDSRLYEACSLPEVKQYVTGDSISIITGDSSSVAPSIDIAERVFREQGVTRQVAGGCGNKLLRQTHGITFALQHIKTCLWDTAAPSSVLGAVGGKVTDYFGSPLIYGTSTVGNQLGVVSSGPGAANEHDQLTKANRSDKRLLSVLSKYGHSSEEGSECVDIVRDLKGHPLNVKYFTEHLNIQADSYSCPEQEAVRGIMSNAARIRLHPSNDTIFYKRIDFSHLDHARAKLKTAPHKLIRDVNSYEVETSFLASKACKAVIENTGVKIPKCYDAILEPDHDNPIESKFSLLLEDFSPSDGWYQEWLISSEEECHAALTVLAKVHAYFWTGSQFWNNKDAAAELEASVWKSGGYIQPQMQTLNQCSNVAAGWEKNKMNSLCSLDFWENLGGRLQSVAEECGQLAHPFAKGSSSHNYAQYKTFTHGDPKQANFLFKQNESDLQVGLIDFQWSGFGLAATDIAHFLGAAVHADRLSDGGESSLLQFYYAQLQHYLVQYGAFKSTEVNTYFSYATFIGQYETGVLDLCRLVIAYAWTRFEQVNDGDSVGKARTMNKNSYNKSISNVVWLMSRCDGILKSRGV